MYLYVIRDVASEMKKEKKKGNRTLERQRQYVVRFCKQYRPLLTLSDVDICVGTYTARRKLGDREIRQF